MFNCHWTNKGKSTVKGNNKQTCSTLRFEAVIKVYVV